MPCNRISGGSCFRFFRSQVGFDLIGQHHQFELVILDPANLIFVATIEVIGLPLIALFFNVRVLLVPLVLVIALATVGFVAVGTLFSAMTVRTRFAELLLPVLLLPFMILPLRWAALATGLLLAGRPLSEVHGWLNMLAVYDVVFVVLAILLFPATVNE